MSSTCAKHKLPVTLMCVYINCKKQRMLCYKCSSEHKQHSENLVQIDDKNSKQQNELLNSSLQSNKNNKLGVSAHHSVSEITGSPLVYNNLANLSLRSNSSGQMEQILNRDTSKDKKKMVSEFNPNYADGAMVGEGQIADFYNFQDFQQGKQLGGNKGKVLLEPPNNLVMKEEAIDIDDGQNSKTESSNNNLNQNPYYMNAVDSKQSKESTYTKLIENEWVPNQQQSKLVKNSQKQSEISTQATMAANNQKSGDNLNYGRKSILESQKMAISPSLSSRHLPFEPPYQFGSNYPLNNPLLFPQGYPPNHLPQYFPPIPFGQQNHFNAPPSHIPHHGYNPYPNFPLPPHLNKSKVNEINPAFRDAYLNFGDNNPKNQSLNPPTNSLKNGKLTTDSQVQGECGYQEKLPFDIPPQKQFENEIFYEVFKQNENIQKICLFLRGLNDIKSSLCQKIDRIKSTFLQMIQMKEEDFSYQHLADSFSGNQVEERLKNYFSKIQHLNQFFEKNQVIYNTSATSRQKQFQLEAELDRILQFSIEKIDPEKIKEVKKQQQSQADPFKSKPEYKDIVQYYLDYPAKFEGVKDKINFYSQYQLEFDGCAKGNPGRSGAGFLIKDISTEKTILEYSVEIGTKTSNQAEYLAMIYGMYTCFKLGIRQLRIQGDSEVIIKHMLGVYQCRSPFLRDYFNLAKLLDELFHQKEYCHVKREFNADADALANSALII